MKMQAGSDVFLIFSFGIILDFGHLKCPKSSYNLILKSISSSS
jgi:hypothetical protein